MDQEFALSVVVPVYNEEDLMLKNIEELAGHFVDLVGSGRWQLILADNGSHDATPEIIQEIVSRWPSTVALRQPQPDYGEAMRVGLAAVDAPWAHIINVEQWDVPFLKWAWAQRDRYDLFIGAKRADPTINHQPTYRVLLSWGLNALLQLLFDYPGIETHGPKLLRMDTMRDVLDQCVMSRGQFDTEFVLRAVRAGLWIAEAPVEHKEHRKPRNTMIQKILRNMRDLMRLRRVLRDVPYSGYVKLHRFSRVDVMAAR